MALKVRRSSSRKVRLISTLIAVFAFIAQPYGGVLSQVASAVSPVFPSTNAQNITNGWANVTQDSATNGSVTLKFSSTRSFASCFEYRADGNTAQKTSPTNFNTEITDGLYPYVCVNNSSQTKTINASGYVEVRQSFGAEKNERFDWTKFNTNAPVPPTCTYDFPAQHMWEVTWGYDFEHRNGGAPIFNMQSNGGLVTLNGGPVPSYMSSTWHWLYVTEGADRHYDYGFADGTVRTADVTFSDVNGCQIPTIVWGLHVNPDPTNSNTFSAGGYVFNNKNSDRDQDVGEEKLAGWDMKLYKENGASWTQVASDTTDVDGVYQFPQQQAAGTYYVCEVKKAGWTQTKQDWAGTPFHVVAANLSPNAGAEGSWCAKSEYTDTADKGWATRLGNVDTGKPTGVATYAGGVEVSGVRYVKNIDELSFTAAIDDNHSVVRASYTVTKLNTLTNTYEGFCGNWNSNSLTSYNLGGTTHEEYTAGVKNCAANPATWTDGTYRIGHAGYDTAGNEGKFNTQRQLFVIDSVAPDITVKASSDGSLSRNVFKSADFKLHDAYKVSRYQVNGGSWHNLTPNTYSDANGISVGHNGGVYGTNTITVEDITGNSKTYTFFLDNVDPTITVKDGYVGDKDARIFSNVSFSLYDAYQVDKYVINGHVSDFTNNNWSDANFQNIKPHLIQGVNTFVLYDLVGNSRTLEFTYDNVAPTATFTHSNNNDNTLVNTDVTSTLHASEPIQTPAGWTKVDDVTFTKVSTENNKGNMTITDIAGNSSSVFFEVKRIDKTDPVFNITDGAKFTSSSVNVVVTEDNIKQIIVDGVVVTYAGSKPNYTVAVTGDSTHTVTVTDKAGNDATITFSIDSTAPIVTVKTPTAVNSGETATITGTVSEAAKVTVVVNGVSQEINVLSAGDWSVTFATTSFTAGSYPVLVSAVDSYGNPSEPDNTKALVVSSPDTTDEEIAPRPGLGGGPFSGPSADGPSFGSPTLTAQSDNSNDSAVLGTKDSAGADTPAANTASIVSPSSQGWKIFGMAWYWWLLILAILAGLIWWLFGARRRRAEETA